VCPFSGKGRQQPVTAYDPVADLASRYPDFDICDCIFPGEAGQYGWVDPEAKLVHLDVHLDACQRRATLAHEIVHLDYGHDGCQPEWVEWAVEVLAASRLMTVDVHDSLVAQCLTDDQVCHQVGVDAQALRWWRWARDRFERAQATVAA
jgi:hypothetical protein